MKFLNETDKQIVLDEANAESLSLDEYIIKRGTVLRRFKDFKKSRAAKQAWRTNRRNFTRGIHRFHNSTDGKRFHRSLGRFLNQRASLYKDTIIKQHNQEYNKGKHDARMSVNREALQENFVCEDLVVLNSLRTHLLLEKTYILPINDQLEIDALFEEVTPQLDTIIQKVSTNEELTEDEFMLLNDLWNP